MLPSPKLASSKMRTSGITSARHLMAIALGMEREAARRYRELALRMRLQDEVALSALFTSLAEMEDKHAAQIDVRAITLFGHASHPAVNRADLPEHFDEEDARSAGLSPYQALAIAVRSGERAFAFFSYVAAYAVAPDLQRMAEQFAIDELAHTGLLRGERRRAWRKRTVSAARPDPQPESVEMLLADVGLIERAAATAHRALAARLRATQRPEAARLFDSAADDEDDLARTLADRLPSAIKKSEPSPCADSIRDGLKLLEAAFDRYAHIAEQSPVEAVMLEAQKFAERALRRLAYVRGALDKALST